MSKEDELEIKLQHLKEVCAETPVDMIPTGLFYALDDLVDLSTSEELQLECMLNEISDRWVNDFEVNVISNRQVKMICEAAEQWLEVMKYRNPKNK